MVQRDGEKWSWITSGGHTLIGIDWHPFGELEADDYHQNYHWQFGLIGTAEKFWKMLWPETIGGYWTFFSKRNQTSLI
jgi:hypothetical protein